jgi:hypothetical protein
VIGAEFLKRLQLQEAGTQGTVGTGNQPAEAAQDEQQPLPSSGDYVSQAKLVFASLGLNLSNQQVIRIVNNSSFNLAVKTACKDPKVKRAIAAFVRALK